jgi:hypothetical protein
VKQKVFQNGLIIKVKSKNIYIYQWTAVEMALQLKYFLFS